MLDLKERELELRQDIKSLEVWLNNNNYIGYDPYDLRGQAWFSSFFHRNGAIFRKIRGLLYYLEVLAPLFFRKLFRVKAERNAKAIGLILQGYVNMYRAFGDEADIEKAKTLFLTLLRDQSVGYEGLSWGYPFHWQSRVIIPRGTPSVVVTGTVAQALFDLYECTKDPSVRNAIEGIREFFLKELNRSYREGGLCFSYTPIDNFKVLNASLFAGSFFARYYNLTGCEESKSLAASTAVYAAAEQRCDGLFYYWSEEPKSMIDHYHMGFTIRFLQDISRFCGDKIAERAAIAGFVAFKKELLDSDGRTLFSPGERYPIDLHAFSETLLTNTCFDISYCQSKEVGVVLNDIKKYKRKDGAYDAGVKKVFGFRVPQRIPYIRWVNAWLFCSMSAVLLNLVLIDRGRDSA